MLNFLGDLMTGNYSEKDSSHPYNLFLDNAIVLAYDRAVTEEDKKKVIQELTSKAGKARLTSMTAKDRSRIAKLGAEARWKNHKPKRKGQ